MVFARFVVGLRELNGIIAGVDRDAVARFLAFNMIGATPGWAPG